MAAVCSVAVRLRRNGHHERIKPKNTHYGFMEVGRTHTRHARAPKSSRCVTRVASPLALAAAPVRERIGARGLALPLSLGNDWALPLASGVRGTGR